MVLLCVDGTELLLPPAVTWAKTVILLGQPVSATWISYRLCSYKAGNKRTAHILTQRIHFYLDYNLHLLILRTLIFGVLGILAPRACNLS